MLSFILYSNIWLFLSLTFENTNFIDIFGLDAIVYQHGKFAKTVNMAHVILQEDLGQMKGSMHSFIPVITISMSQSALPLRLFDCDLGLRYFITTLC